MRLKILFRNFVKFKKYLMKFLLAALLFFMPAALAEPGLILENYSEAVTQSKLTGKPILLYYSADWCPGCHWFSEQLKSDQSLRETAAKVIMVERDCTGDDQDAPHMDYCNKTGYPTFMLLNPDLSTGYTWVGTQIDLFILNVEQFLTGGSPVQEKITAFRTSPTAANAVEVARVYRQQSDHVNAIAYYEKAIAIDPSNHAWLDILLCRDALVFKGNYPPQTMREDYINALKTRDLNANDRIRIAGRIFWNALEDERPQIMMPYWAMLEDIDPTELDGYHLERFNFQMIHYDIARDRSDRAIARRKAQLPEGWQDDFAASSDFVHWCLYYRVNLDQTLEITQSLSRMAKTEAQIERANQLQVLALFHNGFHAQAWRKYNSMQKDGWQERSKDLTDFVFWAWQHKVALKEAEKFGQKLILDLKDPEIRRWIFYYLPKIQNALGHKNRAVETLDKGLEEFGNDQLIQYSRNFYLQKMTQD